MLRIYFMQNWFNPSDPGAVDMIPDESTILRFRHLLERHGLTERIFAEVRGLFVEKGLLLKSGTIVDATIIAAPPSTKNAEKARDPASAGSTCLVRRCTSPALEARIETAPNAAEKPRGRSAATDRALRSVAYGDPRCCRVAATPGTQ
jgi:IS5 family transposase